MLHILAVSNSEKSYLISNCYFLAICCFVLTAVFGILLASVGRLHGTRANSMSHQRNSFFSFKTYSKLLVWSFRIGSMHCCTNSVKESYFAAKDYLLSLQRILFTCQTTAAAAK